ncbi:MAG: HD domain-containing protein [Sporichthyaceae bacterium]
MTSEKLRPGLVAAWDTAVEGHGDLRDALLASWAEPHRAYHDFAHLWHVLRVVEDLAAHAEDIAAIRLAAWYHDAVHDGRPDDEERSAVRAERELAALASAAEVARLVRLTVRHDPAPGDRNGEVLCDADLAILAAPEYAYHRYTSAIRAEYAHVPDDAFRTGRATILQSLLDGPSLFRTPHGREHWEAAARANLQAELLALRQN